MKKISFFISIIILFSCEKEEKTTNKDPMELSSVITEVSSDGKTDGAIELNVTGGKEPYSFIWSNGETSKNIDSIAEGIYTVVVTDLDGDTASLKSIVTSLSVLSVGYEKVDATVYDGQDGSIDLTVSGGKGPYTFLWNDENTEEDLLALKAGYYKVTVTDARENQKTVAITIYEPYKPTSDLFSLANNITRLQQSGLRIEAHDKIIYIDPINLYNETTHDADIIMVTHSHGDHYSLSVITNLAKSSTKILAPADIYSNISAIASVGNSFKIAPDSIVNIDGIQIEVAPAYNSNHTLPNSVGYILTIDGKRIYHSGDTKKIPEMASFNVDIACIPMGQTYTFASISEAAQAARDLGAGLVIPIHYGYAEGTNDDPWAFKELLSGEIDVFVLPAN